jgi:hypothetical protein
MKYCFICGEVMDDEINQKDSFAETKNDDESTVQIRTLRDESIVCESCSWGGGVCINE